MERFPCARYYVGNNSLSLILTTNLCSFYTPLVRARTRMQTQVRSGAKRMLLMSTKRSLHGRAMGWGWKELMGAQLGARVTVTVPKGTSPGEVEGHLISEQWRSLKESREHTWGWKPAGLDANFDPDPEKSLEFKRATQPLSLRCKSTHQTKIILLPLSTLWGYCRDAV